jgi:predicted PurR-regulated permease PerM
VAAVIAYLFTPVYQRLRTRLNVGLSASLTLLAAILTVGVPLSGVIFLAVCRSARWSRASAIGCRTTT